MKYIFFGDFHILYIVEREEEPGREREAEPGHGDCGGKTVGGGTDGLEEKRSILQKGLAKSAKVVYNIVPNGFQTVLRRDGRVVEGATLEMWCTARYRGFESHSLRHFISCKLEGEFLTACATY